MATRRFCDVCDAEIRKNDREFSMSFSETGSSEGHRYGYDLRIGTTYAPAELYTGDVCETCYTTVRATVQQLFVSSRVPA